MDKVKLGLSDLLVSPVCLGTMTFGEQVDEPTAFSIMDRALDRGVNFVDTAEMYSVPASEKSFGVTETIIGNWLTSNPGIRNKVIIATKVTGPSRGTLSVRNGSIDITAKEIIDDCHGSLKRLKVDTIDLYQIHWPARHVPSFGLNYFDPSKLTQVASIHEQLEALTSLVKEGKIRAIGLSNETPYGVHEFIRLSEQYGLARVATVQNAYSLVNRNIENALDETLYHLNVSLLAYSPLAFGLLTGKYDESGIIHSPEIGRLGKFESMRKQRWCRPEAIELSKKYNDLARLNNMTPTQLALAFCNTKWQVASTIIGVTTIKQLDENLDAFNTKLSNDLLKEIDRIRWFNRDLAA